MAIRTENRCTFCGKTFKTKGSLGNHLRRYVGGGCQWDMPDDEFALLAPVSDFRKVRCTQCDCTVAKSGVWDHLRSSHPEHERGAWNQWTIRGDWGLVKHGKPIDSFSAFNMAWARKSGQPLPDDDQDDSDNQPAEPPHSEGADRPSDEGAGDDETGHAVEGPSDEGAGDDETGQEAQGPSDEGAGDDETGQEMQPHGAEALQALDPAGILQQQVVAPICQRIDSVVSGFNQVVQEGLGEVSAKYDVSFPAWFEDFSVQVHGRNFPKKKLSNNAVIDDFKLTVLEFRGFSLRAASYIIRDVTRFLGCFEFEDEAGRDLPNLVVSIFRRALLKKRLASPPWCAKPSYLKSLQHSLKHFVDYLENEERVKRSFGGLTTALGSISRALEYEMGVRLQHVEAKRRGNKAQKDAAMTQNWAGAEVWKELVENAHLVLKHIWSHKDDPDFWTSEIHLLALQCVVLIVFLDCYAGRSGGWELIERADMVEQLAGDLASTNVLLFAGHKTWKTYGTLKKWAPNGVLQALRWFSELPLGDGTYFLDLIDKTKTRANKTKKNASASALAPST